MSDTDAPLRRIEYLKQQIELEVNDRTHYVSRERLCIPKDAKHKGKAICFRD